MNTRKSRRVAFAQPATLDLETLALRGKTENISLHGLMLYLPDLSSGAGTQVRPGQTGELSFVLPGYPDRVVVNVIVRWRSNVLVDTLGVEFRSTLDTDVVKLLTLLGCAPDESTSSVAS